MDSRQTAIRFRAFLLTAVRAALLVALLACTINVYAQRRHATGERKSFEHGNGQRAYRIHVPESYDGQTPVPLVFCFHGGGGTAEVASRMGVTPIADKNGFIVCYPEGLNRHWNDGRHSSKFAEQDKKVDDVAFVLALLEALQNEYRIDSKRVYAMGVSNGGFFSHRLAIDVADKFAAVGIVIATMAKPYEQKFEPAGPVSVLFMNGTKDPFVPYEGGPITPNFTPRRQNSEKRDYGRGVCSSTDTAVQLWLTRNGLSDAKPTVEQLADKDPEDECRVERREWSGGQGGSEVVLYRVEGGGHTIPGGPQYLPERIIGKTCHDFDGLQAVWEFFERHSR